MLGLPRPCLGANAFRLSYGSAILNLDDHRTSAVRLLGLDSLRSQIQAPTAGFGPPFGRRRERQGAHRNHIENCCPTGEPH